MCIITKDCLLLIQFCFGVAGPWAAMHEFIRPMFMLHLKCAGQVVTCHHGVKMARSLSVLVF